MQLDTELATYRRLKPDLLADPEKGGKYVLIKGEQLLGIYPTQEEAMEQGYERYLFEAFMVKKVVEVEPVYRSGVVRLAQPRRGDRE